MSPYRTPGRVTDWRALPPLKDLDEVEVTNPDRFSEHHRGRRGWVSIAKQGVYLVNLNDGAPYPFARSFGCAVFYRHELTKI